MKKYIVIGLLIILILSLSSCIKSVKVKTKPKLGVPVAATTMSLNDFVNLEDNIKSILPEAEIISLDGTKTIHYATGLTVDLSQSFKKFDAFSTSVYQELTIPEIDDIDPISVDIPSIPSIDPISVDVPDFNFTPQNINVSVPNINPANVNPDVTVGEIDVETAGVQLPTITLSIPVLGNTNDGTSTKATIDANGTFSKLTFSTGSLTLDVSNNDDGATVEVDGIIENTDNTFLSSNILTLNSNSSGILSFDLTDKSISDSATITLRATITSDSGDGSNNLIADKLNFSSGTKIKSAEGIKFTTAKSISQNIDPNMGTTDFSTITIDGTFNINIDLPIEWSNVKTEFEATILYNYGSKSIVLANKSFTTSDNLSFLSKSLPPNGTFEFTIDSTFTNTDNEKANIDFTKSPTITVIPEISIKSIDGISLNNTQNIDLPDDIKSVILNGGEITISITDTEVSSINANFEYFNGTNVVKKSFIISNGNAILDMDGLTLTGEGTKDATITINSISLNFGSSGLSVDNITAKVDLTEPAISNVELKTTIKQSISIPNNIENVKFKSGNLNASLNTGSFTNITGVLDTGFENIDLTTKDGTINVDLTGKMLSGTKDATLNISEMSLDFTSNPLSFGNTLSVSPTLDNLKISEATITNNINQSVNLPDNIKKVIFGSGSIEITLDDVKFTSINGTLTYDSTETALTISPEGTALIDLTNLELGSLVLIFLSIKLE
ncbi:hypothetical protein [Marinitoga lauensis]|uniref:hypothetical protein n=1 Tax=Marinitoga lauensis TaxID=2201189 RepID=UPI0010134E09|nr:hypothetical protein [Marinitoga lauensis]